MRPENLALLGGGRRNGFFGALLWVRGEEPTRVPAVTVRPVMSTGGASDALFSCFLHFLLGWRRPARRSTESRGLRRIQSWRAKRIP